MKKPWQKVSSKVVYENLPFWQIRKDKVINPSGNQSYYQYVHRGDFVCVIALDDNDTQTYLVRQWRYPTKGNSWEFSMGTIEPKETPLQAAKREFEEETGLKAKSWQKIGYSHLANALTNQSFYTFIAKDFSPGKMELEETEVDMIMKKFSLKKLEQMVMTGEIKDSPTITAFFYLKSHLKNL